MAERVVLTPAQRAFVRNHIPGFSTQKWDVTLAGQAGSQRLFFRIAQQCTPGQSFILVVWDSADEDWPRFLAIPQELGFLTMLLPQIFGSDAKHGLILEQDLGVTTLKSFSDAHDASEVEIRYRRVLDVLCAWQQLPVHASPTIAARVMDEATFLWETDYFARRCVSDFCGCERMLDTNWEDERHALAREVAGLPKTFIHRDFQSENIMLVSDSIRFVDFQGARLGPPAYDVASLIYDPYVSHISSEMAERLFGYYLTLTLPVSFDEHAFSLCAAQRLMQALGAYGNLSIHKGKPQYRVFVPTALDRLALVLAKLPEYPAALSIVTKCRNVVHKEES